MDPDELGGDFLCGLGGREVGGEEVDAEREVGVGFVGR